MSLNCADVQAGFAAAVTSPAAPLPFGVIECSGAGARSGFAVYRNNGVAGLIDALQERFAVTAALVGGEFFRAMARIYVSAHPARSPLLMQYGNELPAFIDDFPAANSVPYLSDTARFEIAWSRAYHAAESRSMTPQLLSRLSPELLLESSVTLHPSLHALHSDYPIADIWASHRGNHAFAGPAHWNAQYVVIVRPDEAVCIHTLSSAAFAFVTALSQGICLQDAAETALGDDPAFDAGRHLLDLFGMGAVVALESPSRSLSGP